MNEQVFIQDDESFTIIISKNTIHTKNQLDFGGNSSAMVTFQYGIFLVFSEFM